MQRLIAEQVKSARKATGAAKRSAGSAASMLNAFYVAVVIPALALAVSCIALWKAW
ncbi:MAG: hypothetical protein IID41_18360 [Planctomycetes bacterium]|nr:hypothetical protein [Planctomycetota bacterium]